MADIKDIRKMIDWEKVEKLAKENQFPVGHPSARFNATICAVCGNVLRTKNDKELGIHVGPTLRLGEKACIDKVTK